MSQILEMLDATICEITRKSICLDQSLFNASLETVHLLKVRGLGSGSGASRLFDQDSAAQEATSELAAQMMREEAAGQQTALRADFESRVRELSEEYERRTQVRRKGRPWT